MKEITDEEYELFRKLTKIWFHTQPDKNSSFFICGECGEHDENGLFSVMKNVTRFEVIDEEGRTYVNYLNEDQRVKFSLQDDDRTLKVFIDKLRWKEDL